MLTGECKLMDGEGTADTVGVADGPNPDVDPNVEEKLGLAGLEIRIDCGLWNAVMLREGREGLLIVWVPPAVPGAIGPG